MLFLALVLTIARVYRDRQPARDEVSRRAYRFLAATAILLLPQDHARRPGSDTREPVSPASKSLSAKSGLLPLGEHPPIVIQALHRLTALAPRWRSLVGR